MALDAPAHTTLSMARGPTDEVEVLEAEHPERGQGLVEYAFILALIVLVLILIVTVLGTQTKNLYSNISNGLPH